MPDQIHYDTLGIEYDANVSEIKNARMALIVEWHPDTNQSPVAEDKIKEINNAFDIIGNIKRRQEYDQEISHIILKRRQNRDRQEQIRQNLINREQQRKNDEKQKDSIDDLGDAMDAAMRDAIKSCEDIERESRQQGNGTRQERKNKKQKKQQPKDPMEEAMKAAMRSVENIEKETSEWINERQYRKSKRKEKRQERKAKNRKKDKREKKQKSKCDVTNIISDADWDFLGRSFCSSSHADGVMEEVEREIEEEDREEQRQKELHKEKENITYATSEECPTEKKVGLVSCIFWHSAYLLVTISSIQFSGLWSLLFTLPFFGILSISMWHSFLHGDY